MKKLLLLLATVGAVAVGCQTDNTPDNSLGVGNEEGTTLTISLAQTRTALGDKVGTIYPTYWSEGDQIVVNGKLSDAVQISSENRASATFRFSNATLSHPYHITYPYCASTSDTKRIIEFPAEQAYTTGSFAVGSTPMCGYAENKSSKITLSHLASILRIPVKSKIEGVVLEKVVITSVSGATLAGEFEVDCKSATTTATENITNRVTYTLPKNFTLSTTDESVFYISVPAVSVGTCTIEFIEASGEKMVANWAPSKPLSKGVVREFRVITYEQKKTITLPSFDAADDEFTIYYSNIKGVVSYSDGSPIANVAVSDGFQVTTTDTNGCYELKGVTRECWYIYCSLPADVKVPIDEKGRPCFFKKYEANKYQYDFEFEQLPNSKEKEFALLAIADPQPGNKTHAERFMAQATPEIKQYTQQKSIPCYGVALGDIISNVYGDEAYLFQHIQPALSATNTGIPIFAVYGNHDNCDFNTYSPLFPDERNSNFNIKIQRAFEETFGPVNYSFNRGDAHIVTLRNTQYNRNDSPAGSDTTMEFTDSQYEWVKQDLALVSKDKMVILCVHIPIFNSNSGNHVQDVLSLLDEFEEAHVLSGHLHFRKCYDHVAHGTGHKVYEQSWSSSGAVANSNGANINCDGAPTGYGVITIKDGHMVKSIHKGYAYGMNDENYQIRLHRGNDITGNEIEEGETNKNKTKGYYRFGFSEDVILANVFSSDPETWQVEVWNYDEATGKKTTKIGDMESLNPYYKKPLYTELIGSWTLDDPRRPEDGVVSGREFWTVGVLLGHLGDKSDNRYHECHTLWRYDLTVSGLDKTAKVMVVARDRWGNEYTETEFQVGTDPGWAIYDAKYNP